MGEGGDRFYGVYRAQVISTHDPTSRGRIEVSVPAVTGSESPRWALLATSAPREGDTVVVAFEEGDIDAPIVLGLLWSGEQSSPLHKPCRGGTRRVDP